MLVTKKTLTKLGSQTNERGGSTISTFARRQMEKMGYVEGKGLGKNEDGITKHLVVKKKEESTGLGLEQSLKELDASTENWWHDAFAASLQSFQPKGKSKKRKHAQADKPPSYDELFEATGGARLGMRARGSQKGKFLRTEHMLSGQDNSVAELSGGHDAAVDPVDDMNDSETKQKKSKKVKKDKKDKKEKKAKIDKSKEAFNS